MQYDEIMSKKNMIMKKSLGIDYDKYKISSIAFNYEEMMADTGYSLEDIKNIQKETAVGNTPLVELKHLTELVRKISSPGKGARIFLKDEAANPSGSFKDRRASLSIHQAKSKGYKGVMAATSGNYGAAVASQAAKKGLDCIIIQEAFDSKGIAQPEITEKARACEAYGAEVLRCSVGPELFFLFLKILDETNFFNASLYTPYSILGIETLGAEIADDFYTKEGRFPDAVVITHAGGGNVTGTARGLLKRNADKTKIIGASVDLAGLHMASDTDFNRKSFTTGHTGFGIPFAVWPDRADVVYNAARPLRYLEEYVTVTQGEVFYMTQALAELEGMERGPAGNTSLTAAFALARQMDQQEIIVVQETEYTGAGKHPTAQLNLAKKMGIKIKRGNPRDNIPGKQIVFPEHPSQIKAEPVDLEKLRLSYFKKVAKNISKSEDLTNADFSFLSKDTRLDKIKVKEIMDAVLKE